MMKTRNIEKIIPPPPVHWVGDGFRVHNFIPHMPPMNRERMSPFILLDYNSKYYFPPAERPRGVGVHPHRGFETVSIAYKGKIAHHARGRYGFGYDPIFIPDGHAETFGELGLDVNAQISHRAKAMRQCGAYLKEHAARD